MSHNWIFLIYCYFSFICPVLSFFPLAAGVCGVLCWLFFWGLQVACSPEMFCPLGFLSQTKPFFYTTWGHMAPPPQGSPP